MHKKGNKNVNEKYDFRILNALLKLPIPLKTFDNHLVYFDSNKRNETIYEHIANKKHRLHLVDIKLIPDILNDKKSIKKDRNGLRYRSYIGKRKKRNEKNKYLKIVTYVRNNNRESIITICTSKNN